jgi:hypothetical protein
MPVYEGRRMREGRPLAWRTPAEGGTYPRARRNPLEGEQALERGGARSREVLPLERGGAPPEGTRVLERGGACSRGFLRGRLDGPLGSLRRGPSPAWLGTCMVRLSVFCFVAGFKWGFPRCLRGPLGLSLTVAPEHLWVCH